MGFKSCMPTGEFLSRPECEKATDIYYELNCKYNKNGANGFFESSQKKNQDFRHFGNPDKWRRRWDSNPRAREGKRISSDVYMHS